VSEPRIQPLVLVAFLLLLEVYIVIVQEEGRRTQARVKKLEQWAQVVSVRLEQV
jgi:hypothetical protein